VATPVNEFEDDLRAAPAESGAERVRTVGTLALATAAFVFDLVTPNGVVDGVLYILALLPLVGTCQPRRALYLAAALCVPMYAGFVLSPMGVPFWIAATNRLVAAGLLWVVAVTIWRRAAVTMYMEAEYGELRRLHELLRRAAHERLRVSKSLEREIDLELRVLEWRISRWRAGTGMKIGDLPTEAVMLQRAIRRTRSSLQGLGDTPVGALLELHRP
jgi:hypothetical protein